MIDITLASRSSSGDVDHDRPGDHRREAAAEALHHPEHDQELDRGCYRTADGAQGADQPADDERCPPTTLVRQRSTEQLAQGHAEEERGQGQTDQRRRGGQVGRHLGEGRGVHVGRERRHRALQGQRQHQRGRHRRSCGTGSADPTRPSRPDRTRLPSCRRPHGSDVNSALQPLQGGGQRLDIFVPDQPGHGRAAHLSGRRQSLLAGPAVSATSDERRLSGLGLRTRVRPARGDRRACSPPRR